MARIEAHAVTLDAVEIDLGDAIGAAAGRLRLASPGRPVEISLPPDGLEVLADWDRLGQILDNLLQNADRHAPPGTPITVEATPGKRSMVVLRVIDRGPGVPEAQRERIFERFVRGVTDGQADEPVRQAGAERHRPGAGDRPRPGRGARRAGVDRGPGAGRGRPVRVHPPRRRQRLSRRQRPSRGQRLRAACRTSGRQSVAATTCTSMLATSRIRLRNVFDELFRVLRITRISVIRWPRA